MRIATRLTITLGIFAMPYLFPDAAYSQVDRSSMHLLEVELPQHVRAFRDAKQKRGINLEGDIKVFNLLAGKKLVNHSTFVYKRAGDCRLKLFIDQFDTPGVRWAAPHSLVHSK